ncbi:putative signal transduction protein [Sulfurimonas denitrificans DSM 1251]|jgi:HD-like signal output (HDOD) protein|uniref:Putative signal transduction protein n=1 Tax=Sulfurimonas denitrificans (strain ATCC 33889 / DSM 1251) TaxID=326298 RepID=Q30RA4_SULDN|nr:HDOD domain-containing protein [Sulfurimonas denitrificans]ABB44477.1 putative signal transduction protein [Sulfurimonas denitrificans DSM 1251]MDD3441659.1 HDOD domain-containing protein [Sulfurimonas denitrificans]
MNNDILAQIDSLPPLPQTVIHIEEFKNKEDKNPADLAKILGKDPLILSTLLKVSNSAMFGFKKKIETPQMAVSLLGVNFTISLALGSAIKNLIETSLEPYGADSNKFLETASQAIIMASKWASEIDIELRDRLLLPTFLLETGKFIIARIIKEKGLSDEFYADVKDAVDIASVEKRYIGASTSMITAAIFEKWGLSEALVNDIRYVDEPSHPENKSLLVSQIVHTVNRVCNIVHPFKEESIKSAIEYATSLSLKPAELEQIIADIKEKQ